MTIPESSNEILNSIIIKPTSVNCVFTIPNENETFVFYIFCDLGPGIYGGKGDREEERIFLHQERVRVGQRIRELRKEKKSKERK